MWYPFWGGQVKSEGLTHDDAGVSYGTASSAMCFFLIVREIEKYKKDPFCIFITGYIALIYFCNITF